MFVTIHDTGIGMSKETQSEVFDKFVRAKNANEINVTGTGLGLFVAKKMVTEMQSKVSEQNLKVREWSGFCLQNDVTQVTVFNSYLFAGF